MRKQPIFPRATCETLSDPTGGHQPQGDPALSQEGQVVAGGPVGGVRERETRAGRGGTK